MASLHSLLLVVIASWATLMRPSEGATTAQIRAALLQARVKGPTHKVAATALIRLRKAPASRNEANHSGPVLFATLQPSVSLLCSFMKLLYPFAEFMVLPA